MLHLYLEFTRYCQYQYCMVSGIQKGGRGGGGGVVLRNSRAIVLQLYGHCRWGGTERMTDSCTKALK